MLELWRLVYSVHVAVLWLVAGARGALAAQQALPVGLAWCACRCLWGCCCWVIVSGRSELGRAAMRWQWAALVLLGDSLLLV